MYGWDDLREITIPANFDSVIKVTVNGVNYTVEAGDTVTVPYPVYERILYQIEWRNRQPANVGGNSSGGIKTAIIKDSNYDNALAGLQPDEGTTATVTYECINMTFGEAYQLMANGEPLQVLGMLSNSGPILCASGLVIFTGTTLGTPCIAIGFDLGVDSSMKLFWTSDGLSTTPPTPPST